MSITVRKNPRLRGLQCIRCERQFDLQDLPEGCPHCAAAGVPASLKAIYAGLPGTLEPAAGTYKYGAWLPYERGVGLGEGGTPCLELPRLARSLGVARLSAKHEGRNPTGSHKDRMSAQAVSRALEVGAPQVVLASSGNAAVSAAAYCAAAGIACEVATYQDMPDAYVRALRRLGARRVAFAKAHERWAHVGRKVREEGAFALTNFSLPAVGSTVWGVEGYRAIALECAADGCVPDHVVVPTARGDLLWGLHSGFADLFAAGLVDRQPRLWAVEPFPRLTHVLDGAPLQQEFPGSTAQFSTAGSTVTYQLWRAVRDSAGGAAVVDDPGAREGAEWLCAQGLWVELCAGATAAAVPRLLAQGRIRPGEHVLLLLTANGDRDTLGG
jgi:threonine synthase